ncbi:MAG: hypothetical protein WAU47_05205 [Desulfobaccales bacterium]
MKRQLPVMLLMLLVGVLVLVSGVNAAQKKPLSPVGEISFEATSVGLGATINWGKGWLTFKGKSYPIKIDGLGLVGVGLSHVSAKGKVYNLKKAQDIAGTYRETGAGIAVIGGVKGMVATNKKGVVIDLTAEQTGVNFNLGGGEFTVTMIKK